MSRPFRLRPFAQCLAFTLLGIATGLSGCANSSQYNETARVNELRSEVLAAQPIKNVVIAHVNLGVPSRNYIERESTRVDMQVSRYLRDNGYNVLPSREFSQRWENAILEYGDAVDPTTGRVNTKTFIQLISAVRDQMREQTNVDAFVFTDLIEHDVFISSGVQRVARFDGVTRKPSLKGPGNGVTADFNWGQPVAAVSLQVAIYNLELEQVFAGVGGIDLTDAIDTRSGASFVRRSDVLENEDFIQDGIRLALHPLVPMKNWPGKTQ